MTERKYEKCNEILDDVDLDLCVVCRDIDWFNELYRDLVYSLITQFK